MANTLEEALKLAEQGIDCLFVRGCHSGVVTGVRSIFPDEGAECQYSAEELLLRWILEKYVALELRPWVKRFPDEYYRELFRLRNWRYSTVSAKRSHVVGTITNDLIYKRLAPGILQALQSITPRNCTGRRTRKFHQHLTTEYGVPALGQHLHTVIYMMKGSSNWAEFYRLIQKAFPRYDSTLTLPGIDD